MISSAVLRLFSLEDRVDRDRRAVQEESRFVETRAGLFNPGLNARNQRIRRRQRLAEQQPAACFVERSYIRERPADIGSEAELPAQRSISRARFTTSGGEA